MIRSTRRRWAAVIAAGAALGVVLTGCSSSADTVSYNLGREAEDFKVERRVVFYNGITDQYMLTIEGRCSIETAESSAAGSLEVTCKTGEDAYKKHFLGLSDNVTYFVEQLDPVDASEYHYKVLFKPEAIVPDIDLKIEALQ